MKREEAIKILRGMKAENLNLDDLYTSDKYKALDMAINLLEHESVLDKVRREIDDMDRKVCQQFLIEDIDKEIHHAYRECIDVVDKYKEWRY